MASQVEIISVEILKKESELWGPCFGLWTSSCATGHARRYESV